jgi:ATP-binding cassette subfamily C protein
VLRIQQGLISIKNAVGGSAPTFEIIEHLKLAESLPPHIESLNWQYTGFRASVLVKDLTLKYPNSLKPAISQLSFDVLPGQSIAIVGASGAGKTSLVDTILGIHIPDSGHVKISGLEPLEAIKTWPGAISYVPQDILIVDGTIKENVALG